MYIAGRKEGERLLNTMRDDTIDENEETKVMLRMQLMRFKHLNDLHEFPQILMLLNWLSLVLNMCLCVKKTHFCVQACHVHNSLCRSLVVPPSIVPNRDLIELGP